MKIHFLTAACSWVLLVGSTYCQTADFEVASVKRHSTVAGESTSSSQTGGPGTSSPGRIVVSNRPIRSLIIEAYGIRNFQIEHPEWMRDARYDIVAKVPAGATKADARIMMQHLLEERFQLKIRREQRDLPVYVLEMGKNGLKMKPSPPPPPDTPDEPSRIVTNYSAGQIAVTGQRQTSARLVTFLTGILDRPIIDKTGLKGGYELSLTWTQHDPNEDALDAEIFAAIQAQLGLKIEQKKMPIDMLIVESALETPIEN